MGFLDFLKTARSPADFDKQLAAISAELKGVENAIADLEARRAATLIDASDDDLEKIDTERARLLRSIDRLEARRIAIEARKTDDTEQRRAVAEREFRRDMKAAVTATAAAFDAAVEVAAKIGAVRQAAGRDPLLAGSRLVDAAPHAPPGLLPERLRHWLTDAGKWLSPPSTAPLPGTVPCKVIVNIWESSSIGAHERPRELVGHNPGDVVRIEKGRAKQLVSQGYVELVAASEAAP